MIRDLPIVRCLDSVRWVLMVFWVGYCVLRVVRVRIEQRRGARRRIGGECVRWHSRLVGAYVGRLVERCCRLLLRVEVGLQGMDRVWDACVV